MRNSNCLRPICLFTQVNVKGSRWVFATDRDIRENYRREHEGSDIAELQAQFNELLRWMMTELRGMEAKVPESDRGGEERDRGVHQ